ncbi:hypothetical protein LSPH24S_05456 [Lysinibacillus sphaericus]
MKGDENNFVSEASKAIKGLAKFGVNIIAQAGMQPVSDEESKELQHKQMTYSAVFSGEDGLWEVNLALDALDGFSAQQPFDEVLTQLYCLVFGLLEELEASV